MARLILLAVMILVAFIFVKKPDQAAAPVTNVADEQHCDADAKCFAEKYAGDAAGPCRRSVEDLARFGFEWIDGPLGPKFSVYERYPDNPEIITYSGDKIKFRNSSGAWRVMTYECDYNVTIGKAIEARAFPE